MCLACGKGKPSDTHGSADALVIRDLERAAEADSISVQRVADKLSRGEFGGNGDDHISRADVERAARAVNVPYERAVQNIKRCVDEYVARSNPVIMNAPSDAGAG